MSPEAFDRYMLFAAFAFGVIGAANLARPHRRWLGAGSVLCGLAALLYRYGVPVVGVAIVCGLALACLVKDVGMRAGQPARRKKA